MKIIGLLVGFFKAICVLVFEFISTYIDISLEPEEQTKKQSKEREVRIADYEAVEPFKVYDRVVIVPGYEPSVFPNEQV